MNIKTFNNTLEFLGSAYIKILPNYSDIIMEFSNESGGPGENMSASIKFNDVCFLNLPIYIESVDGIHECSYNETLMLLPNEYEIDKDEYNYGLTLLRFMNEKVHLPYFILSYGYELFTEVTHLEPYINKLR